MIAEEYFGALLRPTLAPWRIAGDPPTKIFAKRGPVSQYAYGTGYDTSLWRPDWQKGYVCSWQSGRIVADRDADGFEELMERCGIPLSPVRVNTGRSGGYRLHYDGRGLSYEDWPGQRPLYAPDGTHVGDIKSCGFVPVPGSRHPNGNFYQMAPEAGREGDELPWLPGYNAAIDADQEGLGRGCSGVDRGAAGYGRNCELYELKKRLFREEMIDEDDPRMAERILAANAEFRVPLREAEVWHTVLKIKGWVRHGHYNPEVLDWAPGGLPRAARSRSLPPHRTFPQAVRFLYYRNRQIKVLGAAERSKKALTCEKPDLPPRWPRCPGSSPS